MVLLVSFMLFSVNSEKIFVFEYGLRSVVFTLLIALSVFVSVSVWVLEFKFFIRC